MREWVGLQSELAREVGHVDGVGVEAAMRRDRAGIVDREISAVRRAGELDENYNEVGKAGDRDDV